MSARKDGPWFKCRMCGKDFELRRNRSDPRRGKFCSILCRQRYPVSDRTKIIMSLAQRQSRAARPWRKLNV